MTPPADPAASNTPTAGEPSPTATAVDDLTAEVDKWKRFARQHEDRAKANADAADRVKALEAELTQLRSGSSTLEQDLAASRHETLRLRVASKHGISAEDAELLLTGADEDTLTKQAAALAARRSDQTTHSAGVVPGEGTTPNTPLAEDPMRKLARGIFGRT